MNNKKNIKDHEKISREEIFFTNTKWPHFDLLFDDMETGRQNIANALIELRRVHQVKPSSYNMQLFFYPKIEEIINLYKPVPEEEKTRVYNVLRLVDPGNIQQYERMMNG